MYSERKVGFNDNHALYPGQPDANRGIFAVGGNGAVTQGAAGGTIAMSNLSICNSIPTTTASAYSSLAGAYWAFTMAYTTENTSFFCYNPPNNLSCSIAGGAPEGDQNWAGSAAIITATSNHSGGVNVSFADGSVKFIKNSINPATWFCAGSKAGGETVALTSFEPCRSSKHDLGVRVPRARPRLSRTMPLPFFSPR